MVRIKIIVGSTRPNRFGPQVAQWLKGLAADYRDATFELVDLADINLPLLDEPQPASVAAGNYTQEHTKAWSKIIDEADGFIIVTPEYNYGVPAPLKNAIDFLDKEWQHKPVAFVSYGADAGGARSVENFRSTVGWLQMYDLKAHILIPNYWAQLDDNGIWQPLEGYAKDAERIFRDITFWAEQFKVARQKLATP
jgi:NAD(P)H-dependent FMN reductase